jgi:TonB family protein
VRGQPARAFFSSDMRPPTRTGGTTDYALSDDLARLCLPQEYEDFSRKLAWANSICLLFLLIGIAGLKSPKVVIRPLPERVAVVPVVYTAPEEPPPAPTQPQSDEAPPPDTMVGAPVVAPVVVVDAAAMAFSVPVKGPAIPALARYALRAPTQVAPARSTMFDPNGAVGGSYPQPSYPREELMARHEGKVLLHLVIDRDGWPRQVTVKDSTGWPGLDRHTLQQIKNRWRFPACATNYDVEVTFRIE